MTTTEQHKPAKTKGNATMFAGAFALIGCMLACSLPLLVAGGVMAGFDALLAGWWPAAALALAAAAGLTFLYLRKRKARNVATASPGRGCGGTC